MGYTRPFRVNALRNADVTAPHSSDDKNDPAALGKVMVTGFNRMMSVQASWDSVSGEVSGLVVAEYSADGQAPWNSRDCDMIVLESEAQSGFKEITIAVLPQENWRVRYDPNGVTGGGSISVVVYSH